MVHMADGWLLSVSLSVDDVLFKLVIRAGAVGWQLEVALMVDVVLFRLAFVVVSLMVSVGLCKSEFRSVDVRWRWWLSCGMLALVVDGGLFRLALWVSLVVLGLLSWMALLIRAFAVGWLLDGALSSVFVRRWRIYCMMLVDGFRGFVGLGFWFVCVALGRRLWRSLMVEGLLLSLLVDGGLFKLVLCGSVLMDGQFEGGMRWCVLGSLWVVGGLVALGVTVLVVMMSLVGGPLGGWSCDRLLEDGWVVVVLMVGKYISMVV